MNLAPAAAKAFGEELRTVLMGEEGAGRRVRAGQIELALMPPFVSIAPVRQALEGMPVTLGAQNCHEEPQGAFTGEIGAPMLAEMGCHYVIIGHSERRHIFGETDELVMKKIKAVKDSGMVPILCVGELLEEREGNRTLAVLERQIRAVLPQMAPEDVRDHFVVAYEPVWAIGTGKVASEDDAQEGTNKAEYGQQPAAEKQRVTRKQHKTQDAIEAQFDHGPGHDCRHRRRRRRVSRRQPYMQQRKTGL